MLFNLLLANKATFLCFSYSHCFQKQFLTLLLIRNTRLITKLILAFAIPIKLPMYLYSEDNCYYIMLPINLLISSGICSVPELLNYSILLLLDYKYIQWIPIDLYSLRFMRTPSSIVLGRLFQE